MRHWLQPVATSRQVRWNAELARDIAAHLIDSGPRLTLARVRWLSRTILALFATATLTASFMGLAPLTEPEEAPMALAGTELTRLRIRPPAPPAPTTPDTVPPEPSSTSTAPEPPSSSADQAEVLGQVVESEAVAEESNVTLLPTGKGMWFNRLEYSGDSPEQIVAKAQAAGITHLYLRLGSSRGDFYAQSDLDRVLPVAHAGGLKVVGWDFPYLEDPVADAQRAAAEIAYTTPDGHSIDAFSADIETSSEGVQLAADRVLEYGKTLRELVGPGFPLVGTVPNACLNMSFPYAEVGLYFDAIAPMVYWITRNPGTDVACNLERLSGLGLPILPVGQAYDPALDNPAMVDLIPGYEHLDLFMDVAAEDGATGVSFWAWHTASPDMWQAIIDQPAFTLTPMGPGHQDPAAVQVLQRLLTTYGYTVPVDGGYDSTVVGALADLQADLGLEPSGQLDETTILRLTGPRV